MSLDPAGRNAASVLRAIKKQKPDAYELINGLLAHVVGEPLKVDARALDQRIDLRFRKDVGDGRRASFTGFDMSEGTLRILGLLLAVFQPRQASVLIIEEPEATVHPALAELVVEVLLNAARDRQVLITTHSPDLLDAKELSEEQIRVVTMERGRTIIAPLSQSSGRALRERLYTPGELLRIDELGQDVEAAKGAARHLDLFGETPGPARGNPGDQGAPVAQYGGWTGL
jgi:predicted ATPase